MEWWNNARTHYEAFISELVVAEASGGDQVAAQRRLDAARGIPELLIDREAEELATRFIQAGAVPGNAGVDALHVAVATVHGVDCLLTWNCRHINNAETKPILRSVCAVAGCTCPEICTPEELMPEEK